MIDNPNPEFLPDGDWLFCPRCGQKFPKDIRQYHTCTGPGPIGVNPQEAEIIPWTCPVCGTFNPWLNMRLCPHCGTIQYPIMDIKTTYPVDI